MSIFELKKKLLVQESQSQIYTSTIWAPPVRGGASLVLSVSCSEPQSGSSTQAVLALALMTDQCQEVLPMCVPGISLAE